MTLPEFIKLIEENRTAIEAEANRRNILGQLVDMPIKLEIHGEGLVTRNGVVVERELPSVSDASQSGG